MSNDARGTGVFDAVSDTKKTRVDKSIVPVKRYNLAMPEDLFNRLEDIANEKQVTLAELIRVFLKIGLVLVELQDSDKVSIVVRDKKRERELIFPL